MAGASLPTPGPVNGSLSLGQLLRTFHPLPQPPPGFSQKSVTELPVVIWTSKARPRWVPAEFAVAPSPPFFCPHHAVCRILAPWPGIEPAPPVLEEWNLNHWITSEVPLPSFIYSAHVHKRLDAPRHWQTAALISWPLASNSLVGNANNYLCEKCDGSINSTYSSLQKKW